MTGLTNVAQGSESAFPRDEYDRRIARARKLLAARGLDAMIVTGPENIFYLAGHQTPGYYAFQAMVLPVDREPIFVIRQLEYFNFVANTFLTQAECYGDGDDPVAFLCSVLDKHRLAGRRIAIDKRGWFLSITAYEVLQARLGALADAAGVVEQLRVVKSAREIEKIRHAAAYVDAGMAAGLAAVRAGACENDLVAAMMAAAIARGSEYVGMEPLVSSGPRTGVPHGTWRRRVIRDGDPCFLEMAACHDRYHAALMRSAWVGALPGRARDMMQTCEEALAAAIEAIRPGVTCEDVHLTCQRVIDRAGYSENFRKRTGYSIGVSFAPDWGEGSILSLNTGVRRELEPGMTFHIPPALRIYGAFTVGVSETIVVTERGAEILGSTGRTMWIVA
jgi:Xaa-Pro dipeptidase